MGRRRQRSFFPFLRPYCTLGLLCAGGLGWTATWPKDTAHFQACARPLFPPPPFLFPPPPSPAPRPPPRRPPWPWPHAPFGGLLSSPAPLGASVLLPLPCPPTRFQLCLPPPPPFEGACGKPPPPPGRAHPSPNERKEEEEGRRRHTTLSWTPCLCVGGGLPTCQTTDDDHNRGRWLPPPRRERWDARRGGDFWWQPAGTQAGQTLARGTTWPCRQLSLGVQGPLA